MISQAQSPKKYPIVVKGLSAVTKVWCNVSLNESILSGSQSLRLPLTPIIQGEVQNILLHWVMKGYEMYLYLVWKKYLLTFVTVNALYAHKLFI